MSKGSAALDVSLQPTDQGLRVRDMQRPTTSTWLWVSAWWLLTGLIWTGQMIEAFSGQVASSYLLRTEMAKAILWIPFTLFLFWWVAATRSSAAAPAVVRTPPGSLVGSSEHPRRKRRYELMAGNGWIAPRRPAHALRPCLCECR
ncbi:hypothetical protein [Lysobacter sp. CA199]|uniref:hypothetical protein n=1 Tax=Lysobacter sp. CA199 TaxID=3455608 RepID=UPI003F8D16F8